MKGTSKESITRRRTDLMSFVPFGRRLLFGLLAVLSCNGAQAQTLPPASAAPVAAPSKHIDTQTPANLAADARLDRRVSLHEVGMPLDALLRQAGQGDLALAADHNCRDLELHLNLVNRPLRQLMTSLAQLVPGEWYLTPEGKGYTLRMNWKAVSRRQRWWDLYLEERQRVLQNIPALALKAMGARPEIKGEVHSADGNDEGLRQLMLEGPTFFNQIPADLQRQIAHNLNEVSLFAGVRGTGMHEGAIAIPLSDLPESVQKRLRQSMRQPDDVKPEDCYALFKNDGSGIGVDIEDSAGTSLSAGLGMDVPIYQDETTLPLAQPNLMREVKRREKARQDVPPAWKELAAYQESRVWPNVPPPRINFLDNKVVDKTHQVFFQQDRISALEQMAQEDHVEFVSDYYSLPSGYGTRPAFRLPETEEEFNKLETRLNTIAADNDVSWKAAPEKIYLLRNNRWYRDDRLEVPTPLLQRWLTRDMRQWDNPAPNIGFLLEGEKLRRFLDWQAEVVSVLTPWQIFHGMRWASVPPDKRKEYAWGSQHWSTPRPDELALRYRPFLMWSNQVIPTCYHFMLFYATLDKEQRTTLLGDGLDFYTLNGEQQRQAVYLQPLLVGPARANRPLTLRLQHPPGHYDTADVSMHLALAAPGRH